MKGDAMREKFREIYNRAPRLFRAPGRVNIIGEHTDYNEGFVLPFAIDRETLVAGARREDLIINVHALDVGENLVFDLGEKTFRRRGSWIDYVEGAARCVNETFGLKTGADLIFSSDVPIGAGLSSSAALEASVGFALLALNGIEVDRKKTGVCRAASRTRIRRRSVGHYGSIRVRFVPERSRSAARLPFA